MLGATPIVAVLGAVTDPYAPLTAYVREVGRAGLAAVFLDDAGDPVDPRAAVTAKRTPVVDPLDLATTDSAVLQRFLKSYRGRFPEEPLRIGVELSRSRIVEVCCPDERAHRGFLYRVHSPLLLAPTLWDGGVSRYWFVVPPEVTVDPAPIADPAGYVIRTAGVTAIPPTHGVRLAGREWEMPAWMSSRVATRGVSV